MRNLKLRHCILVAAAAAALVAGVPVARDALSLFGRTHAATYGKQNGSSSSSSWYSTEASACATEVPQLTECVPVQVCVSNDIATLGGAASDAGKEGCGLKGNGTAWAMLAKGTVYQALNVSKFCVSFQAALPANVSAQPGYVGITNSGGTQQVVIGSDNAKSSTQFVGFGYNGTATAVQNLGTFDTNLHTWRMTSDGTTVTWYRDGTSAGTLSTGATNYPTAAASPGFYATSGAVGQAIYKAQYCYVGPS